MKLAVIDLVLIVLIALILPFSGGLHNHYFERLRVFSFGVVGLTCFYGAVDQFSHHHYLYGSLFVLCCLCLLPIAMFLANKLMIQLDREG